MDYNRPSPNYELDQEWWWPSYKFTLPLDDLFGSLYTEYNTVTIPIQDPEAFHHDVYETCTVATTASEFHTLLAERRQLRLQELRTSWGAVASRIAARPRLIVPAPASNFEVADIWADFMYFSREFSFDALVKFVSSLTGNSKHTPELVSTVQPPTNTAQKRASTPDEHDYSRSTKRRLSEDKDLRTSEEDSSATDFASAQRCTPPSSVPSPATKAVTTPDSAVDDLGIFQPPHAFYFAQHPDHRWEAEKFGMDLDDVFTTLPKHFNLMAIPILDRESFRLETKRISSIAQDRAEFYELLQSRLEARRKEQTTMMMRALLYLASDPEQIELPDRTARHRGHAMHIARSKSFDTIVRFLAGFLRDEEPADDTATLAAEQDDHSMRQADTASPTQSSENAPSGPPSEILSRRSSSGSIAVKSQKSSTASSPRTRKRSLTLATANDNDEDEDEARPTKKIRFADDVVEPRAASSSRRPISPRARRVRKGHTPLIPQPSRSTIPPTTMASSPSVGPRPNADEAINGDPTEQCSDVSTPLQIHPGTNGQYIGSGLVHPDEKDEGKNSTRDKYNKEPAAIGSETRQGSCRPRQRKGKPLPASPRTKHISKIQKSTTSRLDWRATRTTTGKGSRNKGAVHQTRSSQRLTRRRGQGGGSLHELDLHGKARLVVA